MNEPGEPKPPRIDAGLPNVVDFASASHLASGVRLLERWQLPNTQEQIMAVIGRIGLNPTRRSDIMAAVGYVWATHYIVPTTGTTYDDAGRDEACQAVMRLLLVNPDALAFEGRDQRAFGMITMAANGGLADHLWRTGAIPNGPDWRLQNGDWRLIVSSTPVRFER